ncbi:MAG: hypothetical protein HQL68_07275 [Magnetococcales bacterium]|nr:hypothetical protein [Magnetococcales bacterium]
MENVKSENDLLQQSVADLTKLVERSEKRTLRLERLLRHGTVLFVCVLSLILFMGVEWVVKAEATNTIKELKEDMDSMNNIMKQTSSMLTSLNEKDPQTGKTPIERIDNIIASVDTILTDSTSEKSLNNIDNFILHLSKLQGIQEMLSTMPKMGTDMHNMTQNMASMSANMAIITNNTSMMSYDLRGMTRSVSPTMNRMGDFMDWMP